MKIEGRPVLNLTDRSTNQCDSQHLPTPGGASSVHAEGLTNYLQRAGNRRLTERRIGA